MVWLGIIATFGAATPAMAQPAAAPKVEEIAKPPAKPGETPLPTRSASPHLAEESWLTVDGVTVVRNVAAPTLTPFLPPPDKATGAAVVIAPGGAFLLLAIDNEGWSLARWLQSQGIAAFVLKYRVRPTPPTAAGLAAQLAALGAPRAGNPSPANATPSLDDSIALATDDAEAAMRLIKQHALAWNVDPDRIGIVGFSAGAMTALNLVARNNPETRPAFIAPIYGSMSAPARPVPASPPPMWAAMASDDRLFGNSDLSLLQAWRSKGGAVEFHLYEKGGHGFGFPGREGTTSRHWSDEFIRWMDARGLLGKSQ